MKDLIGFLLHIAPFKSNHEDFTFLFATNGMGWHIFRCIMSKSCFDLLLGLVYFANPVAGAEKRKWQPIPIFLILVITPVNYGLTLASLTDGINVYLYDTFN